MTSTMTTTSSTRAARICAGSGLALTALVTVAPFLPALTDALAAHLRSGYPGYTGAEIESAVGTWQIVLTILSGLGALAWIWTIWSVRTVRRWAPWSATALLTVGGGLALSLLAIEDTSGEVGLAPMMGWIWAVPCIAGAVLTVATWRQALSGPAKLRGA